jgi:hypothetical protein
MPEPDPAQVAKLIAALDSNNFKEREKASAALAALGDIVEPPLRQALTAKATPEQRKRVQTLLARFDETTLSPERLRVIRAIAVLEWINTAQSWELMQAIANGAAGSRQTQWAKAALGRAK